LIEGHSVPASQGHIAGYRIGRDQSAGIRNARARRLLGGDISLERAHYEIRPKPSQSDNKRALADPEAKRLTAAHIGRLVNAALAVKGSPNERAVSDWQATVTAGHPADGCLGGCGASFATSHTRVYEKTPRNGVAEKPAKRVILDAEFGVWKTDCF
jgi:hypothetical protein